MITEDQLDLYRVESTLLRVIRDVSPRNDVRGIVVAWDDDSVLIRKKNRRVVKLARSYVYQPYEAERPPEYMLPQELIEPDDAADESE
ncbi:hypothetical protein HZF08_16360 [Paenibacillus sp. CGMCC 1.16610]|uniref:DUF2642 domain-containing protein n=2 Tax=Paenibacillus TaxID=44249 RepID=A0ABU3RIA4_9BACL|nr:MULTISPECIES: hypothetical protein [Paenibacillus]MBA2939886.1 hypothetical protein [Paenibacillus sp. CGMCC 1.16610]MDU0204015.1 hypothetical protein [Paenibacillus sp. PFR10]MEC0268232.1 hypothetical protein [Paenibacillus anseongense]MVQ39546.1 hypothetical protein [Paenibacillus anseongense]